MVHNFDVFSKSRRKVNENSCSMSYPFSSSRATMTYDNDRRPSHERFRDKLEELESLCKASGTDSPDPSLLKQLYLEFSTIVDFAIKAPAHRMSSSNARLLLKCSIKVLAVCFSNERSSKSKRQSVKRAVFSILRLCAKHRNVDSESFLRLIVDLVVRSERLWRRCGEALCHDLARHLCSPECGLAEVDLCRELCRGIDRFDDSDDRKAYVGLLLKLVRERERRDKSNNNNNNSNEESWPIDADFLRRLLDCYRKATSRRPEHSRYREAAQTGLEITLRCLLARAMTPDQQLLAIELMISWCLADDGAVTNETQVLDYASTLEYAAHVHQAGALHATFTEAIFCSLMRMIGSEVRYVSLLGNRLLQLLIDRGKNLKVFRRPQIFYENMELKLNRGGSAIGQSISGEDRAFLKQHRELVHRNLYESIVNHCDDRANLEATYGTVCLLALEIPCGFTAAAFTCLMMNAQKFARTGGEIGSRSHKYYVHALVISVLTFICWLHKAELFHAYLNTIFKKRAKWAPHFNPPMLERYEFAAHHVLWDKPDLFLLDWEVRFGLWHRFRLVNDHKDDGGDDVNRFESQENVVDDDDDA
uniref:Uncharacterized protein n=1 Tax=Trichogramma kaykai TaxID=54128 RepID=A0ABD2VXV1_9HYME